jgi:hypothetical protein
MGVAGAIRAQRPANKTPRIRHSEFESAILFKPRPFVYKWDALRSQGIRVMCDGPIADQRCG